MAQASGKIVLVGDEDEPDGSKASCSRGNRASGISCSKNKLKKKLKPTFKRTRRRQRFSSVVKRLHETSDLSRRELPLPDLYALLKGGSMKTTIVPSIKKASNKSLSIHDLLGRLKIELVADSVGSSSLAMKSNLVDSTGLDMQSDPVDDSMMDMPWHPVEDFVSEEERAVRALHHVRLFLTTECDPVHHVPVRTRFCKFNLALFDFEKESTACPGPSILSLSPRDHFKLADSINIVSFTILKSDLGYPVSIFGTVLVRDQVDYKCNYLFKRGRDNAQVITSSKDTLKLMDPHRGLAVTDGMFFEINLKVKCDDSGDKDFCKGVIEQGHFVSSKRTLMIRRLTSWHSTVQLAYTPVPLAVAATLEVTVSEGLHDTFTGEIIAWTSGNRNQIILYDSKMAGTMTEMGEGGSLALSRCLVAVPVKEELVLRISIQEDGSEVACFELTIDHLDGKRICSQGFYKLQVMVDWTAILNTSEIGLLRRLGHTLLLV